MIYRLRKVTVDGHNVHVGTFIVHEPFILADLLIIKCIYRDVGHDRTTQLCVCCDGDSLYYIPFISELKSDINYISMSPIPLNIYNEIIKKAQQYCDAIV